MKKKCVFTSFNAAYFAQALLLAESFRRTHETEIDLIAIVVDEITEKDCELLRVFDQIILAKDLNIPNFKNWIFALNIVEAATAVKSFALAALLERYKEVVYLDPDIYVFSRLDEIFDSGNEWNIAISPHQINPQKEKWVIECTELESLKYGVYNLGFLAVKACASASRLASWWMSRCYDYCVIDFERAMFTDQKMFDAVPAMFDGVKILRHPGYNVATWNVKERELDFVGGRLLVGGQHLRFCHFTKSMSVGKSEVEKMTNDDSLFKELFYSYIIRLQEKIYTVRDVDKRWAYDFYADGSQVSLQDKSAFRGLNDARYELDDPFETHWVRQF